jgi:hypothetical protein
MESKCEIYHYNGNFTIIIDNILPNKKTDNILNTELLSRIETTNIDESSQYDSVTFTTTISKN